MGLGRGTLNPDRITRAALYELYKLENPGKYAKLEGFSSDKYE